MSFNPHGMFIFEVFGRLHQTCCSSSSEVLEELGNMVDDIDSPSSERPRQTLLFNRELMLFVFKHGLHILNEGEFNVFFQVGEMSELTMRDLATAAVTNTLPHVNATQSLFNLFQKMEVRSRVLFCGINLATISLCLQHVIGGDLSLGMPSPQSIFAHLFGGFRYGLVSPSLFNICIATYVCVRAISFKQRSFQN